MTEPSLKIFVSSPNDVPNERRRVDLVVQRLNTELDGRARIQTVRWETSYYSAHATWQRQIPEAAGCDVVLAIFRGRLGTPLPTEFKCLRQGQPYPSGTAYEVLSAIEARKTNHGSPDIYVFRYPHAPMIAVDAPDEDEVKAQWKQLNNFFDNQFGTNGGESIPASQIYTSTDNFAVQLDACLRQWLQRRGLFPKGPFWDRTLHSPFPGLLAFEADWGSVFFGRNTVTTQAIARLREISANSLARVPFLLVVGASGSGKSSLLRAGLVPRLTLPGTIPEIDLWRKAIVTPGPDPFLSLAEGLFADTALGAELRESTFRTKELLARQLRGNLETAVAPLRDALERAALARQAAENFEHPRPARLALGIDQLEQLFLETDADTAAEFANLLAAMVRANVAYLIVTLRNDAYAHFQAVDALVDLRRLGATIDLVPPSAAELEQIVTGPVAACSPPLAFEQKDGRSLASLLVADAKGGDALPLLQMTLSHLYAAALRRDDDILRFSDYRGMDVAVTETANEALDALGDEARAELPALITGLLADVVVDPVTGALAPVIIALDLRSFEVGKPARTLLVEAFVAKRLLTKEGDGVSSRVRPVHEALLRIWPRAIAIISETAEFIRVRHTLEPILREWLGADEEVKPRHLEFSPALVEGAQRLLRRFNDDLPAPMREFIIQAVAADAARRDRLRQEQERQLLDAEALAAARHRTVQLTAVGLIVALLLAGLAGWQWRSADAQRDRAERVLLSATSAANKLVSDLAQKFRDTQGVRVAVVEDILDQARGLQAGLISQGRPSSDLHYGQAVALNEISTTLLKEGRSQGALEAAKQAFNILQSLLNEQPEETSWQSDLSRSWDCVGVAQMAQGHLSQALVAFRASMTIRDRLAKIEPANAAWQADLSQSFDNVGDVQKAMGNLSAASNSYQASMAIHDRLAKDYPNNTLWKGYVSKSLERTGDVLMAQGNLAKALESYRASVEIRRPLSIANPDNTFWQRNLSVSFGKLGDVLKAQGHLPQALKAYQAGFAIIDRLANSDPGNADWQRDLSVSYNWIGDVQIAQDDLSGGLKSYRTSFAISDRLAKSDPGNAGWQRDLSVSDNKIGDVLWALGDLPGALAVYRSSLDIRGRLAKVDPDNADWQRDLSVSNNEVGDVLLAQGETQEARTFFQEAFAIADRLSKSDPDNSIWQHDLSVSYAKLGIALRQMDRATDAKAALAAGRQIIARLVGAFPDQAQWKLESDWFDNEIGALDRE